MPNSFSSALEPAEPDAPPKPASVLRPALGAAAVAFLVSRALVYAAVLVGPMLLPERIYPDLAHLPLHTDAPRVVDALARWDSMHYIAIATHGYQLGSTGWDTTSRYLPLYPALMRLLGGWLGDTGVVYAGSLISNGAFFLALILFYALAAQHLPAEVARRSTLFLSIFPTSFFFSAVYTESLFLLLVLGFFLSVRLRHWLLAAVVGSLAALTRLTGLLLAVAPLLLPLGRSHGAQRIATAAAIPTGTLVFLLVLWLQVGEPFAFVGSATASGHALTSPAQHLGTILELLLPRDGRIPGPGLLIPLGVMALFVSGGVWAWRHGLRPHAAWVWLTILFYLAFPTPDPLAGMMRWVLPLFPAYMAFGDWGGNRLFHRGYVAVSVSLLLLCTMLFSQWYWVA